MASFTIKIGTKTFDIDAPLSFKQLRCVEPAMSRVIEMRIKSEGSTPEFYDRMADVILGCVMKKNPEFTRVVLDEEPTTIAELTEAFKAIAKASGMYKEPAEGEDQGKVKEPQ